MVYRIAFVARPDELNQMERSILQAVQSVRHVLPLTANTVRNRGCAIHISRNDVFFFQIVNHKALLQRRIQTNHKGGRIIGSFGQYP